MRETRRRSESPRKLAILFLAVVVPPAVALVWLGVRLLQQDEALVTQREVERRQTSAQAAVNALERSLVAAERWLTDDAIPDHAVRLTAASGGLRAYPSDGVLWVPGPPQLPPAA